MSALLHDARYALRMLRKTPGYTSVMLLTLALGIGANTAIFSMVNGVLLRPLPYGSGDRLVSVNPETPAQGPGAIGTSPLEFQDMKEHCKTLDALAEYHSMWFVILGDGEAERVQTGVVSDSYFDLLGVKPFLGRNFLPGEDKPGAEPVLLLSYDYWKRSHGGDPSIVGKKFVMNDKTHTVVGVLPPLPPYPNANDVWMPVSACPFRSGPNLATNRSARLLSVFGRLRPGASLEMAQTDFGVLARRFRADDHELYPERSGYRIQVSPLKVDLTGRARPTLLILLGTSALVLLIACANVANLSLARLLGREREIAIRVALGASRARLLSQLLVESTLLSLAGGALGLLFASVGLRLLVVFASRMSPRASEIAIDGTVMGFTLVVSVVTGVAFGLVGAFPNREKLSEALKEGGGQSTVGPARRRLRSALIVAQVAVSLMLLVGAGLLLRSFMKLQEVDPGFRPERVLAMTVDLNWSRYNTPELRRGFFQNVTEKLESAAEVQSVALTGQIPLAPGSPGAIALQVDGRPLPPGVTPPTVDGVLASPGYFKTLGTPIVAGREFAETDTVDAPKVAILSRSAASRIWGTEDPLGRRVSADGGKTWLTVVGIAGDTRQYELEQEPARTLYISERQNAPLSSSFLIRTASDPMHVARQAREAVRDLDPKQPVTRIRTLEETRDDSLAARRLTMILISLFALLALVVAATGLGGVIAFTVSQSTREIGIRMALGAQSREVLGAVVRQGVRLVLIGVLAGVAGALLGSRVLRSLLFGVSSVDPATFVLVPVLLGAVALFASYLPARRALAVDPIVALRHE